MWKLLFLNIVVLNILVKCENITTFSESCDRDGHHINNIENLVLSVGSKTIIKCIFSFDINNDTNTSLLTEVLDYPNGLRDAKRLVTTINPTHNVNQLIFDIEFDISQVGLKHNGFYLIHFNQSNHLLFGANFSIEINALTLGNDKDKCQFVDQCYSGVCTNGLCVCDLQYPVYHDSQCLRAKSLLESCYINDQCQYGGHPELKCEANETNNPNKTCICQSNYLFIRNQLKCLLPKKIDENCELSEQCQSYDEKSFCSADHRCQCNKDGCSKRENKISFRYDILIAVIVSVLLLIVIAIVVYKYYNNIKQFIVGLKKRRTTETAQPRENNFAPTNHSSIKTAQTLQLDQLVFAKNNPTNDENIYDDVEEN